MFLKWQNIFSFNKTFFSTQIIWVRSCFILCQFCILSRKEPKNASFQRTKHIWPILCLLLLFYYPHDRFKKFDVANIDITYTIYIRSCSINIIILWTISIYTKIFSGVWPTWIKLQQCHLMEHFKGFIKSGVLQINRLLVVYLRLISIWWSSFD